MVIYRHKEKYGISEMCRFFKVSRSGYYSYVKRMNVPEWDLSIAEKIRECQRQSHRTYGYRRVQIWLDKEGIHRNPKTVLRIMQKYDLLSVIRRKKYRNYGELLHRYPNLLNRDFHADRPNQKWVTDISYIKTRQGMLYLSIIRDLYDNSIVSYKTSTTQNINLVLSTIRAAKRKEKITAEVQLHSDQGFQYTSQAYFKLTQSYNITPSMSSPGTPLDNAPAESFFSTLKSEWLHRLKPATMDDARGLIDDYIHFYNTKRYQLKLKCMTPMEYHFAAAA